MEEKQILKQITLFLSFLFEKTKKYRKYKKHTNSCDSGGNKDQHTALQRSSLHTHTREGLCREDRPAPRPTSKPKESGFPGVGPRNLPFQTSFPINIPLARPHPNTQENLVILPLFQNPGWNSTNPKLKLKNSTPDGTCCFSELHPLVEIHSTRHVFGSLKGTCLHLEQ